VVWHDRRDSDYNIYYATLDINTCGGQIATLRNDATLWINNSMAALASYNISYAEDLLAEINEVLDTLGETPDGVAELLKILEEYLELAQGFRNGNNIAANYWATQAIAVAQEILAMIT
jgi:hypothetical protein